MGQAWQPSNDASFVPNIMTTTSHTDSVRIEKDRVRMYDSERDMSAIVPRVPKLSTFA